MKRIKRILRTWAIEYGPVLLPMSAAVAVAMAVVYYLVEPGVGHPPPTWQGRYLAWLWLIPGWLSKGLLMFLTAGILALLAYRTTLKYRFWANAAAFAGVIATSTLTWATQTCDLTGGITAGLTTAGIIMAGAVGIKEWMERGLRKTLEVWWSNSVSDRTSIGTVQFAQISLAFYMGTVALIAIASSVPAESRWDILAFSGIGITAAAGISERGKLKNCLAVGGSGIALLGSYVEMDRALAAGDGETTAMTILLAAGLLVYVPFTALALQTVHWVRILIAPMLIGGLAFCVTFFSTSLPMILVSVGCNLKPMNITMLIGVSGLLSFVVGVAAFLTFIILAVLRWRKGARETIKNDNK